MAVLVDSATVWKLGAQHGVVSNGATDSATAYVLGAQRATLPGNYEIPVVVPAGAIQAEDATYLLTEDSNYIEAE